MKKTLILVPALNPPKQLIDYVKSLLDNGLNDILLVDDGSKEEFKEIFDTIEKFLEGNIKVFRHAKNLGKGRALKNAFNYFLTLSNLAEYSGVVTADSDGQHRVEDVIKVAKEVEENPNKLILGCRDFNLEQVPPKSKFGNKITNGAFKLFYGKNISDTQTGLRGFPTAIIKDFLDIAGERFEYETKMLIYCFQKEIEIKEVVIETIYFNDNSETHFNPILDSIKIYKVTLSPFLKYIASATSSFILDILSFKWILAILIALGNIEGAGIITISTIVARIISSSFNFYLNKKFVFKYEKNTKKSLLKYYSLCTVQMLLSAILVTVVWKHTRYAETSIKIVVDSILFLLSYFIQQRWVFKRK
ncbi:bifunctional glycosyltransferase family 2/GtrA family protein [Fusobacterium nucleatum subsp. nucleatum ATCC 23726]|uniref:Glycosyltransferase, group 2 family protein n=1 Tax=Fusobacterium nucleatum subsp. nucleatum (strain ATCC 23726 / VPI 4351) TaxID=525283 RepID=D5RCK6_FUSN2|nr:bifunctional glycosyltransferase family 2/GtrA family protein [Fusobacterium nucleatum]AVQ23274.1 dolichol-phosphate mannosyltransferase [Fusobacterium nucleatum subsp. nucleatum ATCC 23726]EFG95515.1 glycosyltransferase, group 2 family protein [Fusobacterium nucleatum subsp. nucleatum ATCC 23726]